MRQITPELTDELIEHLGKQTKISAVEPVFADNYGDLVRHIAKLAYKNKDYLLF